MVETKIQTKTLERPRFLEQIEAELNALDATKVRNLMQSNQKVEKTAFKTQAFELSGKEIEVRIFGNMPYTGLTRVIVEHETPMDVEISGGAYVFPGLPNYIGVAKGKIQAIGYRKDKIAEELSATNILYLRRDPKVTIFFGQDEKKQKTFNQVQGEVTIYLKEGFVKYNI